MKQIALIALVLLATVSKSETVAVPWHPPIWEMSLRAMLDLNLPANAPPPDKPKPLDNICRYNPWLCGCPPVGPCGT